MVLRTSSLRWLLLTLVPCGCADLNAWRTESRRPDGGAFRAPIPAPALFIPGSAMEIADEAQETATPESDEKLAVADLPALIPVQATALDAEETPASPLTPLRMLHEAAAEHYAKIEGYTARLRRREVVDGKRRPEETLLLKFRPRPWSIYLKWLGDDGGGRQAVYVEGKHDDMLHVLTPGRDRVLKTNGQHLKLTLDSGWFRANNRHALSEIGIGPLVHQFGEIVSVTENQPTAAARLKDLGVLMRPEFEHKVRAVIQSVAPDSEELLPKGGQRLWFFDAITHLPILIITHDASGAEVEYYCFQDLRTASFADDDFDPKLLRK